MKAVRIPLKRVTYKLVSMYLKSRSAWNETYIDEEHIDDLGPIVYQPGILNRCNSNVVRPYFVVLRNPCLGRDPRASRILTIVQPPRWL